MVNNEKSLASLLNRKIELWYNTKATVKNELGQYDMVEMKAKEVWAGVIPQIGTVLSDGSAGTKRSQTTHKIVTRYCNDIQPDMWFLYKGKRYEILYILDPYDNHERLEIFCSSV